MCPQPWVPYLGLFPSGFIYWISLNVVNAFVVGAASKKSDLKTLLFYCTWRYITLQSNINSSSIFCLGPEYGTTEAAWKAVLIEADRRCDMHLRVKDQLLNDTVTQIKQWQKDNFHKTMMNIKEKKEMDDSFKKVSNFLHQIYFLCLTLQSNIKYLYA